VIYRNGGNIRLDKFNACTTSGAQMTRAPGGFPFTVSAFNNFAGCGRIVDVAHRTGMNLVEFYDRPARRPD